MNLVIEPWIPVVTNEGKPEFANLMQVFTDGDKYADLSVRPHERVALMRLLICIAQAALDGPVDKDDWMEAPKKLPEAARKYLEKWNKEETFELFHPKRPFLQIAELKPDSKDKKEISVSKLDFALSTGDNSTLFDHDADEDSPRIFTNSQIVIMILTFQSFSAGGLLSPVMWLDNKKPKDGNPDALCIPSSMYHTFLRGENIGKSIALNLLTKCLIEMHYGKGLWGKPIWEAFPLAPHATEQIENATKTYLGRLTPLCRWIKLNKNRQTAVCGGGFKYPMFSNDKIPYPPEPSATVKNNKKKRFLLGATHERSAWRELSALTLKRNENSVGGALTLFNMPENESFDIYVSALIRKPGKQVIENFIESVFAINGKIMIPECNHIYEDEVNIASTVSIKLKDAIEEYRKNLCCNAEEIKKKATKLAAYATRTYWTAIEKQRHLLMAHVDSFETEAFEVTRNAWRTALHKSAREAYISACGQDTPRQIRAFALGWKKLFMEKKAETETDEQNNDGGEEL